MGVIFFSKEKSDTPPQISIGENLYKGSISRNGLLRFDEQDIRDFNNLDKEGLIAVTVEEGLNFYYSEQNISLADLVSKINPETKRILFITYSPGGEMNKGIYLYPGDFAGQDDHEIENANNFMIKRGMVFALYAKEEGLSYGFKSAKMKSSIPISERFVNTDNGWIQVASNLDSLSETIAPIRNCVHSVWTQVDDKDFVKVQERDFSNYRFQNYYALWLKIGECREEENDADDNANNANNRPAEDIVISDEVIDNINRVFNFPVINNFSAAPGNSAGSIYLSWSLPSEFIDRNNLAGYLLWYATDQNLAPNSANFSTLQIQPDEVRQEGAMGNIFSTFELINLNANQTYWLKIKPVFVIDNEQVEADFSNISSSNPREIEINWEILDGIVNPEENPQNIEGVDLSILRELGDFWQPIPQARPEPEAQPQPQPETNPFKINRIAHYLWNPNDGNHLRIAWRNPSGNSNFTANNFRIYFASNPQSCFQLFNIQTREDFYSADLDPNVDFSVQPDRTYHILLIVMPGRGATEVGNHFLFSFDQSTAREEWQFLRSTDEEFRCR